MKHEKVERNVGLLGVLIAIVISFSAIIEIIPLFSQASVVEPVEGMKPRNALQLAGQNIYVAEGCYNCHSQQIRPFVDETLRYGHYSLAGESVYDRPHQWGSKRTGPDLARVGGRYSDEWHEIHLIDPRALVPESNMPGYPWLAETPVDVEQTYKSMKVLRMLGHPYSDEDLAGVADALADKTDLDALVAYLQNLGTAVSRRYQ
ncbi:cytochrome-c oxidase, cbb3-type subunit II [Marinicella sp. S6413]|uniref:cytochrome-c oxidase, cbb3-type subunit II n=1 Tax=Marinicella gelatinilytica TaxID=2996017 RepID=UPI00226099B0|nr:cytochrome-c oxidase, cbb3-type subunit II [Marinicella gelatinilytica]MCX7545837.1 cytochrome-c oxidase, cbb3-type subunit II [Marinicella gelatinilytica]